MLRLTLMTIFLAVGLTSSLYASDETPYAKLLALYNASQPASPSSLPAAAAFPAKCINSFSPNTLEEDVLCLWPIVDDAVTGPGFYLDLGDCEKKAAFIFTKQPNGEMGTTWDSHRRSGVRFEIYFRRHDEKNLWIYAGTKIDSTNAKTSTLCYADTNAGDPI